MTHRSPGDPGDMLGEVQRSPDHWQAALDAAQRAGDFSIDGTGPVVVVGMGGSGIAADIAGVLSDIAGTDPIVPVKGYRLPAWVGSDSRVVAVSYSGNTEETLAIVDTAIDRGCRVWAITSGGGLAERVAGADRFDGIPTGRQPRASTPYLAAPLLLGLARAGLLPGLEQQLDDVPGHLRECMAAWGSHPTDVAGQLVGRVPVFTGGQGLGGLIALRGRCQVNENANAPAVDSILPESNHNEVVGWGGGPHVDYGLVEIIDQDEHPRVARRFDITRDLIAGEVTAIDRVALEGPSPVARIAAGLLFVDLVSVHLALLTGVDPTPVDRIGALKERMAQ